MNPRLVILLALVTGAGRAIAADSPRATSPAATSVPAPATVSPAAARPAPIAATKPRSDSAVAPAASFDTFRLISDRNIFNPNRTGRRDRSEDAAPRLDIISLVGTMDSDKGLRAFFDGSDAAYRKALHVGESVEKFKVTKIEPNTVDLERDGKSLSVHVGQQLRRPEGAEWNLISEAVVRQEAQARADAAKGPDPSAPVAIPPDASEALRRLMEARNKQLKQ